jgi:hypothetical protein
MSLNKAIQYGKEYRKPYRGSARFDRSCRNHGTCPWCQEGRKHSERKRVPADLEEQFVATSIGCAVITPLL